MKATKRALSLLMALVMCLSVMSFSAFAALDADEVAVATINDEEYGSLAKAAAAAQDGDTIVMLRDSVETRLSLFEAQGLTLDLAGHTVERESGNTTLYVSGGELTIEDTIGGGSVKNTNATSLNLAVANGGSVILNGVTLTAPDNTIYLIDGADSVTINGGTINGKITTFGKTLDIKSGTTVNGNVETYHAATTTIQNGATVNGMAVVWGDGTYGQPNCKTPSLNIYGTISNPGAQAMSTQGTDKSMPVINVYDGADISGVMAVYLPAGALTVYGGTLTGSTAIYFKSTNLVISGGVIHGTGEDAEYSFKSSGANSTGNAVVIDNCNYPGGIDTISITGGILISDNTRAVGSYAGNGKTEALGQFISGGAYSDKPDETYIVDGYSARKSTDNMYYVLPSVLFDPNGGTLTGQTYAFNGQNYGGQPVKFGETATEPAAPTLAGYTFSGWTLNNETYDFSTQVNEAVTLVAQWTTDAYTVTWLNDDGSVIDTATVAYGEAPTHADASKDSTAQYTYAFDGWEKNGEKVDLSTETVTADVTYTATFTGTPQTYALTWVYGNGEADKVVENVSYGSTIAVESDPSWTGHTFKGWDSVPATMPAGDLTITAQWDVSTYTVRFVNDDGTVLQTSSLAYGATPSYDGATPTKAATTEYTYAFSGWTPAIATVTGDADYTATYTETPTEPETPTTPEPEPETPVAPTVPVVIFDDPTPLAGDPDDGEVEIGDEETPLTDLPNVFTDVDDGAWYRDAVAYVYANGLMNGVGDSKFDPKGDTTRAMIVTILYRLAQGDAPEELLSFSDVELDKWYTEAVAWAKENDIAKGVSDLLFAPTKNVTREQLAAFLFRYAAYAGYDVSGRADLSGFADADSVHAYALDAMSWAVDAGIINGVKGSLKPTDTATRAQVAAMLMRFCEAYTAVA